MSAKVRQIRGAWWLVIHFEGKRRKKRIGKTKEHKRKAERFADEINARLALGQFRPDERAEKCGTPFAAYAAEWLRTEVDLPIERELVGALSVSTAKLHRRHVTMHLNPVLGKIDISEIRVPEVQAVYDLSLIHI